MKLLVLSFILLSAKFNDAQKFQPFSSITFSGNFSDVDDLHSLHGLHGLTPFHSNRLRRSIGDHFDDSHCIDSFETSEKTIIRTIESKSNGAVFLNNSEVDSYELCLRFCCETTQCTVAIFDSTNSACYLFDCGPSTPEEFKCRFTGNEAFTSGALLLNRQAFDASRWDHKSKHQNLLQDLISDLRLRGGGLVDGQQMAGPTQGPACGQYEFTCQSGDCIAIYDLCNGIAQCSDGSDEDPAACPPTTPKPVPVRATYPVPQTDKTTFPRPSNIDQWGREGERYSVNGLQPTAFQHRNPAVQVPPYDPRYNMDYSGYKMQQQYQQPPAYYPGPVQNGYMGPVAPQQVDNRYPVQNFLGGPQQFAPVQLPPNSPPVQPPTTTTKATTARPTSQKSTSSGMAVAVAVGSNPETTTQNAEEILKNEIIKNLDASDFVMETPTAAIFTLVVGSILSSILCAMLICRCRGLRHHRSRKRNLASDADGDYLVNGLYL